MELVKVFRKVCYYLHVRFSGKYRKFTSNSRI